MSSDVDTARQLLLARLKNLNYCFITPTPATHARVLAHKPAQARDLRDIFGWSLPFAREAAPDDLFDLMERARLLEQRGGLHASTVRVSTLGEDCFLHSAFPTTQHDAVFFGPDSYRFAAFLQRELPALAPRGHIVDIGAGSGVGALTAWRALSNAYVTMTDINHEALRLATVNCLAAGLHRARFIQTDTLANVDGPIDCIIANPPYIADAAHRAYRDGGALHGGQVSLDWARAAAERLEADGAFLLYTGSAIVNGEDRLKAALTEILADFDVTYRELDPDVFGEEIERDDYADVERIAVVGVVAIKRL